MSIATRTGGFLLLLLLVQAWLPWEWTWLVRLQEDPRYKLASGLVLLGLVAAQWLIAALRASGRPHAARRAFRLHIWMGALTPLALYLHSTRLGYGLTWLLGVIFLINVMMGLFHHALRRWLR